mmetsp:Transcript_4114/g.10421  ORF Transcript_4114/g.10421 Transcript_4114/m.10421 type:complete len:126 (-) Transcript_4114:79-456(-)
MSRNAADFAGCAQDLTMDGAAREIPGVAFVHACPGFVRTAWGTELPTVMRWAVRGIQVFAKSESAAGAAMGTALVDPRYSGGFHLMSHKGQPAARTSLHSDEAVAFMWGAAKDAVLPALTGQQPT